MESNWRIGPWAFEINGPTVYTWTGAVGYVALSWYACNTFSEVVSLEMIGGVRYVTVRRKVMGTFLWDDLIYYRPLGPDESFPAEFCVQPD